MPSLERQAELESAYEQQKNTNTPYKDVAIRTLGELHWIMQQRGWYKDYFIVNENRDVFYKRNLRRGFGLYEVAITMEDNSEVNFSGARFNEANLSGAFLSGANLSGAHVTDANLSGVNLIKSNLLAIDLSRPTLLGLCSLRRICVMPDLMELI